MVLNSLKLNNGVEMPQLGFGVWQVPDAEATPAVAEALKAGYRSIDTAAIYGNERGTGEAIAQSGVHRDEVFVTTKLWNSDQGHDALCRQEVPWPTVGRTDGIHAAGAARS